MITLRVLAKRYGETLAVDSRTHRIPDRRVDEVLETVGLTEVGRTRAGAFSLGIAAALLGDPTSPSACSCR